MRKLVVMVSIFVAWICFVPQISMANGRFWTLEDKQDQNLMLINSMNERPLGEIRPWNVISAGVRYALEAGVPTQTLILVLLLPALGTLVTFCRYVIGLPTIGMIFPLALAATLLSTGLILGIALMMTILAGSLGGRYLLKQVRIMHFAKMSMSFLVVSIFVLGTITVSALIMRNQTENLSFLPVLVLIILSERLTALGLNRTLSATLYISGVNVLIAIVGFWVLSSMSVQRWVLMYPEILLILIPINILLGRYFGLRLSEMWRFRKLKQTYGSK